MQLADLAVETAEPPSETRISGIGSLPRTHSNHPRKIGRSPSPGKEGADQDVGTAETRVARQQAALIPAAAAAAGAHTEIAGSGLPRPRQRRRLPQNLVNAASQASVPRPQARGSSTPTAAPALAVGDGAPLTIVVSGLATDLVAYEGQYRERQSDV